MTRATPQETSQEKRSRWGRDLLRADVSVADDCRRAVDETVRAFGRLDILFNNAGVYYPQTALECSEREWDEQIDVNLKGTFLMSKCALPVMIAQQQRSDCQQ